ncbi:hypothetical protein [Streptomyces sp. NPDC047061]|uniref:hypothetical protein n=1 Tax=Streptomyces sp. NPDC047061 TaxID=3154605 RepID=UPI0034031134
MIEAFVRAVETEPPDTLLQREDFATAHARPVFGNLCRRRLPKTGVPGKASEHHSGNGNGRPGCPGTPATGSAAHLQRRHPGHSRVGARRPVHRWQVAAHG